jgi:hypothetical protein
LQEERRLREELEARHLAEQQRLEELVGFVSSLGAAMGRTIPASLITPLPQPATPVSTNILVTLFQPDIGNTRKNMQSQTCNVLVVALAAVVAVAVAMVVVMVVVAVY